LEINGGHGNLTVSKIEGAMQVRALSGDADLTLIGGSVSAVFGSGNVNIKITPRSWRGRQADFQLAAGTLSVEFPQNLNADIDAGILRAGKIENSIASLKPRGRGKITEKSISARAGSGGAVFSFTVGDGTLRISEK
jgi:hypothetical protein